MDIHYPPERIDEIDSTLLSFYRADERLRRHRRLQGRKGPPVYDPPASAEDERHSARTPEKYTQYAAALYALLFELSRTHQETIVRRAHLCGADSKALESTERVFPKSAPVACQGGGRFRSSRAGAVSY